MHMWFPSINQCYNVNSVKIKDSILWCMCCVLSRSVADSLRPHRLQPTRLLCSWGFSRQEYWGGLPCPPLGELSNPGIEPKPPALQVDSLSSEPPGKPCLMYECDQHFRKQLFSTGRIRKPGYYNLDRGDGDNRGWDGQMASLTRWTWVWASSGSWWWTGKPGSSWGCRESDMTEWLNWLNWLLRQYATATQPQTVKFLLD